MNGDMRDRLIEILKCAPLCGRRFDVQYSDGTIAHIADHLIANGVILPPCKVGDKVWVINKKDIYDCSVYGISIDYKSAWFTFLCGGVFPEFKEKKIYYLTEFGQAVFLTREEAEKALAEKEGIEWLNT